jgi:hypothetical protein
LEREAVAEAKRIADEKDAAKKKAEEARLAAIQAALKAE